MGWVHVESLSAIAGVILLCFAIYFGSDGWPQGVLCLATLAFITSAFAQGQDYRTRILILVVGEFIVFYGRSLYLNRIGMRLAVLPRAVMICCGAVAMWSWLQHGVPLLPWVIPLCSVAIVLWLYVTFTDRRYAPAYATFDGPDNVADDEPELVEVEVTPMAMLLKRDQKFMQGIYDLTNGRPGIFVEHWQLLDQIELTAGQLEVAADRLAKTGRIEVNKWHYALKRRGSEDVERAHRNRKRASMTNNFHFHSSASGVFGSHNRVSKNEFHASGTPAELVNAVLAAVEDVRPYLDQHQEEEMTNAVHDLAEAGDDASRQRRAVTRLTQIAKTIGEIGAPLVNVAATLLKVLS